LIAACSGLTVAPGLAAGTGFLAFARCSEMSAEAIAGDLSPIFCAGMMPKKARP